MHNFRDVLEFWFSDYAQPRWFVKEPAFDDTIRTRFGQVHRDAHDGRCDRWQDAPEGALALIITLDQFPRNMFRGTPRAFASDEKARAVARLATQRGFDFAVDAERRKFFYLPFEHSEILADQELCLALFRERIGDARLNDYALKHKVIIERFGRFPHRNATLGRETTPEEADFLKGPNSSF
ncbi:MAG: DUF924 domain-containing protein [Alphaproteobacteria bacterium]|nr:DUF924 domain-containing protein [Alphaproteobacteria bacterium]